METKVMKLKHSLCSHVYHFQISIITKLMKYHFLGTFFPIDQFVIKIDGFITNIHCNLTKAVQKKSFELFYGSWMQFQLKSKIYILKNYNFLVDQN